jgi:hypothetical protein
VERAEAEAILDGDRETALGLLMGLGELVGANRRLEARVSELERRLGRNSRNSSTPPSQDPPGAPERKRASSEGRDPGGQPGHPGHGRRFVPIERVDEVVEHWPEQCGCGHLFSETERDSVGAPARHQVFELPPIAVLVFEHWLHRLRCPGCGATARAELPAGVPSGSFGPRLEAAVATLSVRNRVSRRDLVELMGELFGCELSSGTVDAIVQRAGTALAAPYQDLLGQIRGAPAVNVDETGWRRRGGKRTLWGAFTASAALLRIAPDRHERELTALLGDQFDGTCCSDRWWAYNSREPEKRQVCWSHLLRDFTSHAEGMAAQKAFGEAGLLIGERLFKAWHQFQHDGDRAETPPRPPQARASNAAPAGRPQKREDALPPIVRQQPAEDLARALDLHDRPRRRANQQRGRARPPRRRHLPQALLRQPVRTRRTNDRTAPLRLPNMPAPTPLPLRLPHRPAHRENPRRPRPAPDLNTALGD